MIGRMLLRNLLHLAPDEALTTRQPHDIVYRIDVGKRALGVMRLDSAETPR